MLSASSPPSVPGRLSETMLPSAITFADGLHATSKPPPHQLPNPLLTALLNPSPSSRKRRAVTFGALCAAVCVASVCAANGHTPNPIDADHAASATSIFN